MNTLYNIECSAIGRARVRARCLFLCLCLSVCVFARVCGVCVVSRARPELLVVVAVGVFFFF